MTTGGRSWERHGGLRRRMRSPRHVRTKQPHFSAWTQAISPAAGAGLNTVVPGASDAGGVASFAVAPVGQGAVADAFRVSLTYSSAGASACRAVVLKLSKADAGVRATNLPLCTSRKRDRPRLAV